MRSRSLVSSLVGLALLAALVFVLSGSARVAGGSAEGIHSGHGQAMQMSEEAMRREAKAYWETHPRVGNSALGTPAATFFGKLSSFDLDGNASTVVDTAKILVGETVLWQWQAGLHTVTNGYNSGDPAAGTIFDAPLQQTSPQFQWTFTSAGTFPFFCVFHEFTNMRGIVVVSPSTGVTSPPGQLGFTSDPTPNPTEAGSKFAFALTRQGRARAEVFDARGRRIAVVLNEVYDAGSHVGQWDGRTSGGTRAQAGIYYLRLMLPGYAQSRAIVIAR